jgi:hypothetical protein
LQRLEDQPIDAVEVARGLVGHAGIPVLLEDFSIEAAANGSTLANPASQHQDTSNND